MYTTSRTGNNGKKYVGININNKQFEVGMPQVKKNLMNRIVGINTPGGNQIAKRVIKGVGNLVSNAKKTETNWAKTRDDYYRKNAPEGAVGGTNKGEYKLPTNVKLKK